MTGYGDVEPAAGGVEQAGAGQFASGDAVDHFVHRQSSRIDDLCVRGGAQCADGAVSVALVAGDDAFEDLVELDDFAAGTELRNAALGPLERACVEEEFGGGGGCLGLILSVYSPSGISVNDQFPFSSAR